MAYKEKKQQQNPLTQLEEEDSNIFLAGAAQVH